MKKTYNLIRVASKLEHKYAQGQSLQEAIQNAASRGTLGIMNFPAQLQKDGAVMSMTVTKDGSNFTVSQPVISPPTVAQNYAALPAQIKQYLDKYYQYLDNQTFYLQY